MGDRNRKKSSHRAILLHFHDDGGVCPESLGGSCPHGGSHVGAEPASPDFLKNKLPNGFNINNLNSSFSQRNFANLLSK